MSCAMEEETLYEWSPRPFKGFHYTALAFTPFLQQTLRACRRYGYGTADAKLRDLPQ